MKHRKKRRSRRIGRILICFAFIVIAFSTGAFAVEKKIIGPNMEEVAGIKATAVVSRAINKALSEEFSNKQLQEGLFTEKRNDDGSLEMVQANSIQINLMMSKLSMNLQDEFACMKGAKLPVSMGALLGSKVLSQSKPDVTLSIAPLSVSSMDFKTEFETQGINQTKYKIYVVIACRVKVLAPFSSRIINTTNTVLIAETVILGKVPTNYVEVPKEDILDVT